MESGKDPLGDSANDRREIIRLFEPKDGKICHAIFSDCIRTDPYIPPQTRKRLIQLDSPVSFIMRAREYYTVVLEENGEVLATGGLALNEIRALYVSVTRQRTGLGTRLMEHLEARVDRKKFDLIFLNASLSAEGFYRRLGYRSIRRQAHTFDGLPLETIYMEKKL